MKVERKETLSEKFSEKKKRGYPRLILPEFEKAIRHSKPYSNIRTLFNENNREVVIVSRRFLINTVSVKAAQQILYLIKQQK